MPGAALVSPPRGLPRTLFVPLAILFSLIWASAFIAVKHGLNAAPPLFLMGFRFLLSGLVLAVLALALRRALPRNRRQWLQLAALGVLNYGIYLGVSGIALRNVSGGMGAVLASTNPLLVAIAGAALLRERMSALRVAGFAIAFAAVAAIMWSRTSPHDQPPSMLLILFANVFLTAGTILFKRWQPEQDVLVLNGVQLLAGAAVLLVPSLLLEPDAGIAWTSELVLALAYLVLAVSLGAMSIWFLMLRTADASAASAWFFLNPVFGLLLGALLLAEPLHALDFAGALGVGVGIFLVQRG